MPIVIPEVPDYDPEAGVLAAALAYGKAGLYLAPTVNRGESPGKNPGTALGKNWQTRTVTGSADVYAIFAEEHPDACGIALHCGRSGLVVIDIDTEDGALVPEPVIRAIEECKPPSWGTRRGAALQGHYVFEQPPGRTIGNSGGRLGSGWGDIRGKNGVVILPGSWHPNIEHGLYHMWTHGEVPALPAYLADALVDSTDHNDAASGAEVAAFLNSHISTLRPDMLALGPVRQFTERVTAGQGRHTSMLDAACWAMREARAGLYPARDAVKALASALTAAVAGERSTTGEMMGITAWAVAQANATPEERLQRIREEAMPRAPKLSAGANETHATNPEKPIVKILPSPNAPLKVARAIDETTPAVDGVKCARWWEDNFYRWNGAHWAPWKDSAVEGWLYRETEHAQYITPKASADDDDDLTPDAEPAYKPWTPNRRKIAETMNALGKVVWRYDGDAEPVLACANGHVDLKTRELTPASPRTFNLWSLPFDYDPDAGCPRWMQFLEESLPGDGEAHEFLSQWFGYVLSGRTDQQKIASLIGKKRGGKGTVLRTLGKLLTPGAIAAPDITDLGSHFGRAGLVGKALAVMSDVRWNSNLSSEALKTLLMVSGEDVVSFPRKHQEDWSGKCGVRFMAASNDVPHFADRSNAIGSRMIHVKFTVTFEGREDFTLESKLDAELPGILNWALDGLASLDAQGRFTVPASGLEIAREMEESANPVRTWLDERCELTPGRGEWVAATALLDDYCTWAERRRMKPMSMQTFLTALRQAADVRMARRGSGKTGKYQAVEGVKLGAAPWGPLSLVK